MLANIGAEIGFICSKIKIEDRKKVMGTIEERMQLGAGIDPLIIAFMNKLKDGGEKTPLSFLVDILHERYATNKLGNLEMILFARLLDIQYMVNRFKHLKEMKLKKTDMEKGNYVNLFNQYVLRVSNLGMELNKIQLILRAVGVLK